MKGLLVKDWKLMKVQKNFFVMLIVLALGMAFLSRDVSFIVGYLTLVMSMFTLTTISYDEFDNGNTFLFTLPITRASYVIEKYCFSLLLGCGAWILATLVAVTAGVLKGSASVSEIMMVAFAILPAMLIMQSIMIPFHLKFGGDLGRIAIIGVIALFLIIGIVIVKAAELMGIDIAHVIYNLPTVSLGMLAAVIIAVALVLFLVSIKVSISIMNKKEF